MLVFRESTIRTGLASEASELDLRGGGKGHPVILRLLLFLEFFEHRLDGLNEQR